LNIEDEVRAMDPVTLIAGALAAGALAGTRETASAAVKDAYATLRDLLKRQLAGKADAELVLARHENAPETWTARLKETLAESGVGHDHEVVAAAQELMALLDGGHARSGKYVVDLSGAHGAQVGDHGSQLNIFNAPQAAD
jgi:hypothetical protein